MTTTVFYNSIEISAEVFDVNIRRGRSREFDDFSSATGSIRMRNYARNFDPPWFGTPTYLLLESGDFVLLESGDKIVLEQGSAAAGAYGTIEIGGTLVVKDGAVTVFTGHVEDVNYTYDVSKRTEAEFIIGDAMTSMASTSFQTEWATTDDQLSGARITELLARTDVALSGLAGTINGGTIHLQGGTSTTTAGVTTRTGDVQLPGANVLAYAQLIARTEHGKLWVDKAGLIQYRDRYTFPSASSVADFDDTGTNFQFGDIGIDFGSEQRAWAATVTRAGGIAQTATATATPPTNLGQRGMSLTGLLYRGDAYSLSLAEHLAQKASNPEAVVSSVNRPLSSLSTSDRATIAAVDIDQTVTMAWTPTGSGSAVTQTLVVEGVSYQANANRFASMQFQLSAYPNVNYFTWDTDSYDSGVPFGF